MIKEYKGLKEKKSKTINMCKLKTEGIPADLSGFVSFETL